MENEYSGPTSNMLAKDTDVYSETVDHKIASCRHITLPLNTKIRDGVVLKMSSISCEKPKSFSVEETP